jgi:hypothetical protein
MAVALVVGLALLAAKHVRGAALPGQSHFEPPDNSKNPRCTYFTHPISVTGDAQIYDISHVNNNIDAVKVVLDVAAPTQRNCQCYCR